MDINLAVKGYMSARERLEKSFDNPHKIADIILKIATYNSYIGEHLGELKAQYETDRATCFLAHLNNTSASAAENLARADTATVRGQIAKLELTYKSADKLVSVGQSRLKAIESEARNQT